MSHVCVHIQALKSGRESVGFMQSGAEQASWLQRLRGSAYVAPHELLAVWRADFEASGLQHTPASFTALVQVNGSDLGAHASCNVAIQSWVVLSKQLLCVGYPRAERWLCLGLGSMP